MWMIKTREINKKPTPVKDIQNEMIKECFPPDEKAITKTCLMQLKMPKNVEDYITSFCHLVDITGTPIKDTHPFLQRPF